MGCMASALPPEVGFGLSFPSGKALLRTCREPSLATLHRLGSLSVTTLTIMSRG